MSPTHPAPRTAVLVVVLLLTQFAVSAQHNTTHVATILRGKTVARAFAADSMQITDDRTDTLLMQANLHASKKSTIANSRALYVPEVSSTNSIVSSVSSVNLESEMGDQSASATVAMYSRQSSFSIALKQPFKEKPSVVTPLKLDGLDNSTSLQFSAQHFMGYYKSDEKIQQVFDALRTEYYLRTHPEKIPCSSLQTTQNGNTTTYSYTLPGTSTTYSIDSLVRNGCCCDKNDIVGVYYDRSVNSDDKANIQALRFQDLPEEYRRRFVEGIYTRTWIVSGSIGLAKNSFDYITDNGSVTPLSKTYTNHNLKIGLARILSPEDEKKLSILALTFSYSRSLEAASDPATFNFPVGAIGNSYEKEVSVGVPGETDNARVALEWRKKWDTDFHIVKIKNLAFSPSVTYLFNKKSLGMYCPFYFLQSKEDKKISGVQGGIKLAYLTRVDQGQWASFSKGFAASVFIAAPFDIFKFL